jgi:hypothetical protein
MIDAALLRAIGSERASETALGAGAEGGREERREACAFALAAIKAGEALMDGERFARMLARIESLRITPPGR